MGSVSDGCGHAEHGLDCNCDVKITEVIPIRYSYFDSAMGEAVVKRLRLDLLDLNRDDFVKALVLTGEMYERFRRDGWHGDGPDSHTQRKRRIRTYLAHGGLMEPCYLDDDHCQQHLAMDWDEVLTTLAKKSRADRPSRLFAWDGLDWFRLDTAAINGEPPSRTLARELKITTSTLGHLLDLYSRTRHPAV